MKKLAFLIAMAGSPALLGGCAAAKVLAMAPYEVVYQNALDVKCAMRSQVLVGPCKKKDFSDCAPNYPVVKECIREGHWECDMDIHRLVLRMDPTLGVCPGN